MRFTPDEMQFSSLYLTRFATSFGFMTVLTLLPDYINALGATGVTIGLFITALEVARTVGIIPLGWAGDRYSKRLILVGALIVSALAYLAFAHVTTIAGFLTARFLQGLGLTGTGLLGSLSSERSHRTTVVRISSARTTPFGWLPALRGPSVPVFSSY